MKRLLAIGAALVVGLTLLAPIALAADPPARTGRVLISTEGDVTVPAGDRADLVVVVGGTATVRGEVNTIVVVNGMALFDGATVESVIAAGSRVELTAGTVVLADIVELDSTVQMATGALVQGRISDLGSILIGIGGVLAGIAFLLWIGFALATIAAGLLLAGLAARQVRAAETLISHEPVNAFLVGLLGLIVTPIAAAALVATIVGAPLGIGILILLWPFVAFLGYLVAAIWVGDWILARSSPDPSRERPYLAAVVGVVVLGALALVPILAVVGLVASLLGFGAVVLLAWRTFRSGAALEGLPGRTPAPVAG